MPGGELLEIFLTEAWDGLALLEGSVGDLRATDRNDDHELGQVSLIAHRLRGSAGLYGYPQLASLAGLAERLTESRPHLAQGDRETLLDVLELVTLGLRRALTDLSSGQAENAVGLYFAEVGGVERLQALLKSAPAAFRTLHPASAPDTATGEAAPTGLQGELRTFARTNAEVYSYFAPEVREYLEALRTELDRGVQGNITLMFRSAHTIKGSAFMVGLPALGNVAHRLEDLMNAVREQGLTLAGAPSALLLQGVALLERMLLTAEGHDDAALTADGERLSARIQALLQGDAPTVERVVPDAPAPGAVPGALQTVRVSTERLDGIMDGIGQLVMSRARLERQLDRLSQLEEALQASHARVQRVVRDFEERYLNPDMVRSDAPEAPGETPGGLRGTVSEVFEELEFDSYDDMNILARSVTELSADLGELRGQFRDGREALRGEADTFTKLLRTLRGNVVRTRRVPLSQAYARPRRWARGRKDAELVTLGGDLDVDAFVTQGLSEVLLHLVTNAFTHGLETPDAREAAGKPTLGRVTVDARRRGTLLDVTVSDDGRGIDVDAVRAQALERGLRSARELEQLSDDDTLRLIFLPGLSTAREVTNEAGRGVGMDIVASTVRRLGGELLVQSAPGTGSTFTLRVPLSQQVVDLLTVRVGPYLLGFPAGNIAGLRELHVTDVQEREGQAHLPDGTPLHLLQRVWGVPSPTGTVHAVVIDTASGPLAFGVDRFEGIAEAVVSAPGPLLDSLGYVTGTSVTPDGEPVLLPDAAGLARAAVQLRGTPSVQGEARSNAPGRRRLLLIDDSLSVRRVVSRMLERAGYTVVTASDGQEALDLYRQDQAFEAILTDLEMPRVNGFEVIEDVRRRDARVPIVVMTTRAGDKHQRLAFQLGASDYFSKPVEESLLTRCLERLLRPA